MAYLIAWMPQGDRDTMRLDLLRENVTYALRARAEFPWAQALPDSVFLNDVLPYAVVDEVRDSWRRDFYERFAPRVKGCTDIRAALDTVNRILPSAVGVEYNTLREKTNQSPSESMRQGMASCTGLSILLVDALRSVGIPARFAGTASWHDDRGNHSWTEVRLDDGWHFTEFYQPSALDRAWFLADAGQAVPGERKYAIYAVSFRPTGDWFPMVWNEESRDIHAEDVSQSYRDVYAAYADQAAQAGTHTTVTFRMFRDKRHATESGDRIAANVDVFCGAEQMGGGRTAGPLQDMNDALKFLLEKKPHLHVPLRERPRRADRGQGQGGRRADHGDGVHGVAHSSKRDDGGHSHRGMPAIVLSAAAAGAGSAPEHAPAGTPQPIG